MFGFLNYWQLYVVVAIISDVVFTQTYKLAAQKSKDDSAITAHLELIAGISLLIFTPFFPFLIPTNPILYFFLLLSTFFAAMQDRIKTTARRIVPASESAILNELTSAFIIIIGFTVFRQPFIWIKVLGAVLIFVANVLLVFKQGRFVINKGVFLFIIACALLSVALSFDIGVSQNFNIPLYIATTYIFSAVIVTITNRVPVKNIVAEFSPKQRKWNLAAGISWGILGFAIIRAAQTGPIIVVVPLMSLSVMANVLVASIVHKEQSDIWRKVISAGIIIVGITLTTLH